MGHSFIEGSDKKKYSHIENRGRPFGDLNSLRVTVHRLIDTLHLFDFHYQEHIIARVLLKDKFVLGDSYQT